MTKEEKRAARREKRSKFLTRMVDEFKKIVLVLLFPLFSGVIIWSMILYTRDSAMSPTVPIAAMGFLSGAYFVYCSAASKDKDSLNKNGLIKTADGAIKKAVSAVGEIVSNVTGKATVVNEETEDSDEIPISSCGSSDSDGTN